MTATFYLDISKYQPVITADYQYPILCFRADSGWETDPHAAANYTAARKNPRVKLCIAYVVYLPGHNAQIMTRLKALFGAKCPPGLAFMIDMESGAGFAGPGNHSTEANQLANELADYAGSMNRVIGYANTPDWAGCWPTHPSWLKRIVARYSSTPPSISFYGWQYSDGSGRWGVPAGYPHPANVDMNVIPRSIDQILTDFAVTPAATPAAPTGQEFTMDAEAKAAFAAVNTELTKISAQVNSVSWAFGNDTDGNGQPNMRDSVQNIVDQALDEKLKPLYDHFGIKP